MVGLSPKVLYKIPIEVPKGRNGIQPNLSLYYNSYNSNGWIGVGWDLNMGFIQRSTKYGVNYGCDPASWSSSTCGQNYEKSDFFVSVNGSSNELVLRPEWDSSNQTYGKKIEQDFSKYYFYSTSGGWQVTDKNGTIRYYGSTAASRQTNSNGTFKWFLDKVQDVYGNYMTVSYYTDTANGQLYLQEIDYTLNGAKTSANKVVFTRSTTARTAADTPISYVSQAKVKTAYLLSTVSVYGNGQLARSYGLTYTTSGDTSRSLLEQVVQYGSDGKSQQSSLPDNAFTYQSSGETFGAEQSFGTRSAGGAKVAYAVVKNAQYANAQYGCSEVIYDDNPTAATGNIHVLYNGTDAVLGVRTAKYNADYQSFWTTDMYGSGESDIVYVDSNSPSHIHVIPISQYSSNAPDNDLGALANTIYPVAGGGHARMADVNGDGLLDFIYDTAVTGGTQIHVLINNGNGTFTQDNENTAVWATRKYIATFKMADVNGDGLADLVFIDGANHIWVMLSTGSSFNSVAKWGAVGENEAFNLVDVNGDGLPDLIYLNTAGQFRVLLNTGTVFAPDNATALWGTCATDVYPSPGYALADVNGDGLPDVVYDTPGNGIMVMTNTGSSFKAPKKRGAREYPYATGTFLVADANSDGLSDFVYDATVGASHEIEFLPGGGATSTMVGTASDLMSSATTGIGGTYSITYGPSMVYPSRYLPYLVQTPSIIVSNDGNGNEITADWNFVYGCYNYLSREFRGFGNSVETLPDSAVTWTFLQDDVGKGLMTDKLITNIYPLQSGSDVRSSNAVQKGETIYEYREWQYSYYDTPGGSASGITYPNTDFPAMYQSYEIHYDANTNTPQKIGAAFTYDATYGNMLSKTQQGDVNLPTPPSGQRQDQIQYAGDTTPPSWLLARPSQVTTTAGDGALLSQTMFAYSSQNNPVSSRPTSKTFCLSYSKPFDFSNCTAGVDPTIQYTYDNYGNLFTQTDPNLNPTTIVYDSTQTFPQTITDPRQHSTQITYNYLFSKPASKIDSNNNETDYTYDFFGRVLTVVELPNDSTTYPTKKYFYNNYGAVGQQNITLASRVVSGNAGVYSKSVYFDGLGRTTSQHSDGPNGASIYVDTVYDANGRLGQKSYPYLYGIETEKWTQYTYDPLGRLLIQTNPGLTFSSITYAQGTTNYTDPEFRMRTEVRDAFGQLTTVTQYQIWPTPFTTSYQYDPLGNLLSITDPENNQTSVIYDSLSRRIAMADPDMGSWSYGYDSNGNLTSQIDANGNQIIFSYDAVNRITLKHLLTAGQGVQASPDTTYTYDQTGTGYQYTIGRLTTVIDASGSTSFPQYDRDGRVLTESSTVNGNPYTLQKTYDDLGRITTITYPDSELVSYTYDTGGNLSSAGAYATFTNYTGLGQPQSIAYGNQVTTSLTYNTATDSRLHSMVTTTSPTGGDAQVQNLTYSYDGDGNVLFITDGSVNSTGTLEFVYDNLNRLGAACSTNQSYGQYDQTSFEYTPSGNIHYNTMVGYYSYTGPQPHAVTSAGSNTYTYDLNGNMTNRNGQAMAYDQENRLVQAGSYSYVYNYKGMRAVKNGGTPSSTTSYFNKFYECTNGACTKHIFAGIRRIASKSGSGAYYYQPDHLGGLNVATDSLGNLAETNFYYPYGVDWIKTGSVDLQYKFAGQENDPETGVYYYKARYYDPVLGRFVTPDPLLQAAYDPTTFSRLPVHRYLPSRPPAYASLRRGDNIAKIYRVLNTNPYTYVQDNPVNSFDPTGLWTLSLGLTVSGQIGPLNINFSGGLAIDGNGNIGTFETIGGGLGVGAGGSLGISGSISNAQTIMDLQGPFATTTFGAGAGLSGSWDSYAGPSDNGWVTGSGLTLGLGLGGAADTGISDTWISPLNSSALNNSDLQPNSVDVTNSSWMDVNANDLTMQSVDYQTFVPTTNSWVDAYQQFLQGNSNNLGDDDDGDDDGWLL
ncbi:MAG: FG-GAP-like repeat-containing protein [Syntrophobacteraceae bacterium]